MRTVSANFRKALFDQESAEVPIFLVTITHDSLATPIRLSTDATERLSETPLTYGTTSRGDEYLFVGMEIAIPDEGDRMSPASKLTIQNVSRELIPLARSVTTPPRVAIECVLASDPDTVEFSIPIMEMAGLQYDAATLTFSLVVDALSSEPFGAGRFTPAGFPGLFY